LFVFLYLVVLCVCSDDFTDDARGRPSSFGEPQDRIHWRSRERRLGNYSSNPNVVLHRACSYYYKIWWSADYYTDFIVLLLFHCRLRSSNKSKMIPLFLKSLTNYNCSNTEFQQSFYFSWSTVHNTDFSSSLFMKEQTVWFWELQWHFIMRLESMFLFYMNKSWRIRCLSKLQSVIHCVTVSLFDIIS